jgi:hypothetical protein
VERKFRRLPGAEILGLNVADLLNCRLSQDQEIEADGKAVEICLALHAIADPLKTPIDLAGIDVVFQNLTLTFWLGFHHGIVPPGVSREQFLNQWFVGEHPLPPERRKHLQDKLLPACSDLARQLMGSTADVHGAIVKELNRRKTELADTDGPIGKESEFAQFLQAFVHYSQWEGIKFGEQARQVLGNLGAVFEEPGADAPRPRTELPSTQVSVRAAELPLTQAGIELLVCNTVSLLRGEGDARAYARIIGLLPSIGIDPLVGTQ